MQLLRDLWTNRNISVALSETPEAYVRSEDAKVVQLSSVFKQTARFATNGEVRKLLLGPLIADRRVHLIKLYKNVGLTPKGLRVIRKRNAHHSLHTEVIQLIVLLAKTSASCSTPATTDTYRVTHVERGLHTLIDHRLERRHRVLHPLARECEEHPAVDLPKRPLRADPGLPLGVVRVRCDVWRIRVVETREDVVLVLVADEAVRDLGVAVELCGCADLRVRGVVAIGDLPHDGSE